MTFLARQFLAGQVVLIVEALLSQTHLTRQESSGRVIRPSQRPISDNTQHSQETNVHAVDGIRNRNPSTRAAADPHFTMCDHCNRHLRCLIDGSYFHCNKSALSIFEQ